MSKIAKSKLAWFNFRTGEYDFMSGDPENMKDYIPQGRAAQGLYDCYIALGDEPMEATRKVLSDALQIKHD